MWNKIYYYPLYYMLYLIAGLFVMDVAIITLVITNYLPLLVTIVPLCFFGWVTWYLFYVDFFTPIYMSETKIKFKGKEYCWDDITVTAYPIPARSICDQYDLYFGLQPCCTKEQLKKTAICRVYLQKRNLDKILCYYKKKIVIATGCKGYSKTINAAKKLKRKIEDHNSLIAGL